MMNFNLIKIVVVLSLVFLAVSCTEPVKQKAKPKSFTKKEMINSNRKQVRVELDQIRNYIKRRGWEMTETGTGLRYMIYENGPKDGAFPKDLETVFVNYEVSLINGKGIYKSSPESPASFIVGHDEVESGLQEAIQFMKPGDKAMLIIPSHLAHGYSGDFNKIPKSSTVIFDIELLYVK